VKKHLKDIVKFLLFFALGILFIWLSVRNLSSDDIQSIFTSLKTANYFWVVLCVFVGILSHIIRARRWIILMEPLGYTPPLRSTFYAVMVGYLVNMALPRFGEVTCCAILNKYEKVPFTKSLGTVVTERAFDLLIFLLLFLFIMLTQASRFGEYLEKYFISGLRQKIPSFDAAFQTFLWTSVGLALLVIVLAWIYRRKLLRISLIAKIWNLVRGFLSGMKSLIHIKRPLEFILLTVAMWILYFLMVYLCFFSIVELKNLGLGAAFSVLVLGSIGVIVTPGGIGLYPVIVAETLKTYGVSYTTGLAFGWISWAAQAFMIIITGSVALMLLAINKKREEANDSNLSET